MSEELPTGHEFVEASHGITPAPISPEPAEPEAFGPGIQGVMDAGNALTRERGSSESEPVERFLEWKSGSKAGQRVDLAKEGFSLTPETAAKTLSEVHRTEDAMEAHANLSELQREVDLARSQLAGQQPQPDAPVADATPAQPDASQPQPEAGEQPSGIHPKIAAVLADPEARALLEQPLQQAEQARQQYAGAAQQIADVALCSVLANFPELQGVSGAELPTVLAFIQKQDPVKAQAIQNQLQQVNAVYSAAQQAKAQQAQMEQAQLRSWAAQQDTAFEHANRGESKETMRAAAEEILNFAVGHGISKEALGQLYATQPIMRSSVFQQMMLDAAKYRMAQRTATANPASRANIPPVQRPGIAASAGERSAVDLSELRSEFKRATGNEQLRLAAKLQQAQRRARG